MNDFYRQAKHNKTFLDSIIDTYADLYFDWKITVTFYIAIHLLKCLAKKRGCDIGHTHEDISRALNPRKCAKQAFPFPEWAWNCYSDMLQYSKTSRYDGISDESIVLIAQKKNYKECEKLFKSFCSYMNKNGISL